MGSLRCSWRFVRLLGDLFFLTGYRFEFLQKLLNQLFFRLFVELAETNRFHRWLRLRALNQLLKHPKLAGWCHLVEAVVTGAHNHQCRVMFGQEEVYILYATFLVLLVSDARLSQLLVNSKQFLLELGHSAFLHNLVEVVENGVKLDALLLANVQNLSQAQLWNII